MAVRKTVSGENDADAILIPLPDAVDLIRFEKNLLQMGFFGAHDVRHNSRSTRRIEQSVIRGGQRMKIAAEFRGSQELGLPSTSDRDKYLAFMRIAMNQRRLSGQLSNPVRFTGYRLLKELGLSFAGDNYEDINRWGQRMVDTTITSEHVIYLAARKSYANKTVHVFRSFTRTGASNLDGTGITECYEVVLEDWLLENLNQGYVVPEDFNAYRKLKRPTAKGVFGFLHLWFHASKGCQVEKDYADLCMLLNVPVYRHVSKIRETMGRSLDELIEVRYLEGWDIRPMLTKDGFKLIFRPGDEIKSVLAIARQKQLAESPGSTRDLGQAQTAAAAALVEKGIAQAKARELVQQFEPAKILDYIEYTDSLSARDRKGKITNPPGLLIHSIENQIPFPASFLSSRRIREEQEAAAQKADQDNRHRINQFEYEEWCAAKIDEEVALRFPAVALIQEIKRIVAERVRRDYPKMIPQHQEEIALQYLRRDLRDELILPSFDEWHEQTAQLRLL
jgi:hypothetical protein